MFPTKLFHLFYSDGSSERVENQVPIEKHHRADVIVEVNVATGASFVVKNRRGPVSEKNNMHFKNFGEIKNLHKDTKTWPIGIDDKLHLFRYDRNRMTERHSCDIPMRNGTTGKTTRYLIPTKSGGYLNVSIAAYRAIESVLRNHQPEALDHLDIAIKRIGQGMYLHYEAYALYNDGHDDARHLGILRGKADFQTPSPETNLRMEVLQGPPPTKNVILDNLVDPPPAAKAICCCDMKDLLSTGHTPGCPEKKR